MEATWHGVFQAIILILMAWLGSGLTQQLKLWFPKIADRGAVALTALVSALFAVAELFLSKTLGLADFTVDKFPAAFAGILALSTVYYAWFKGSEGFLGQGGVLRKPE